MIKGLTKYQKSAIATTSNKPLYNTLLKQSNIKRLFTQIGLNHLTKFYKRATVEEYTLKEGLNFKGAHFTVTLDGKKLKTPDGHPFFLPSKILAEIVALEFNSQDEYLRTSSMPMFGISKAAIDIAQSDLLK